MSKGGQKVQTYSYMFWVCNTQHDDYLKKNKTERFKDRI